MPLQLGWNGLKPYICTLNFYRHERTYRKNQRRI